MTKDENMNIRQANAEDLAFVRTLLADNALPNSDVDDSSRIRFLIADDADGHPAACIGIEAYGSEALLRSLAVPPAMRGRGVGRSLVVAAEDTARAMGVSRLYFVLVSARKLIDLSRPGDDEAGSLVSMAGNNAGGGVVVRDV